jgi:hypothetical protein
MQGDLAPVMCKKEKREGGKKRGVNGDGLNLAFERHKGMGRRRCMVVLNKSPMCKTRISTRFAKLEIFNSKGERVVDGVEERCWSKIWCGQILNELN